MKRLIIFSICLTLAMNMLSQDIIVTVDAKKIEAKILEVSKSEIKYKEFNYQDGPTFVLETVEINSIIYANGKVVVYTQQESTSSTYEDKNVSNAPSKDESMAHIVLISGDTITAEIVELKGTHVTYNVGDDKKSLPSAKINKVIFLKNGQVKVYQGDNPSKEVGTISTENKDVSNTSPVTSSSGRIFRDNGNYFHNDIYISSKEVARILERENKAAYKQWKKADGMLIGGAVCIGVGSGLVVGGLLCLITGNSIVCLALDCAGLVPLGVGLGLTLGASSQYNKAIDLYNSKFDQATIQFKWRVAPNEIGLAIAF